MNALVFSQVVVSTSWLSVISVTLTTLLIGFLIYLVIAFLQNRRILAFLMERPSIKPAFLAATVLPMLLLQGGLEGISLRFQHIIILIGMAVFLYFAFLGPTSIMRGTAAGQQTILPWILSGLALAVVIFIARDLTVPSESQLLPRLGELILDAISGD